MKNQRGSTLLEVLVAAAVLLTAMGGFVGVANEAAGATATGHRRTVGTYVRQEVLDRTLLTSRDRLDTVTPNVWMVDACYDVDARQLGARNVAYAADFACPDRTVYRSWIRIEPIAGTTRLWRMRSYAERVVPGCTADQRYASKACMAGDFVVSD